MLTLCFTLGAAFAISLVLTPLLRALARHIGLVDQPDGRRKIHGQATPVAGGLVILVAGTVAVLVASSLPHSYQDQLRERKAGLWGLLAAALVLCGVGLADDFRRLRVRHKVLGQILAVGVVMSSGLVVRSLQLFDWGLDLGLFAVPFTALWLLGAINSLNLLDGMDGMLTTVGLIISSAMVVMAVLGGQGAAACVAIALAGALLGFLRYNFPPATVFLGDSGSMLIGLVVGVLAIQSSLKGPATIALASPLALLTVPLFDTMAAIIRRKLTGRSLCTTDRGHLHHCLLGRGLSNRRVLLWVSLFCLLTVLGVLTSLSLHNEVYALLSALAVVGILVAGRLFGYAEFLLVKDRLKAVAASLLQTRCEGQAHQTGVRLQGSANWEVLWNELTECALRLNLKALRFDLNAPAIHEGYHARWRRPQDESEIIGQWRAELPLTVHGHSVGRLEIVGQRDGDPIWRKIATLTDLAETTLSNMTQETTLVRAENRRTSSFGLKVKQLQTS
jgi:UDP-GlcNAc:undecaprenyl-phosphate GlcNAc-1-phosphate transferase